MNALFRRAKAEMSFMDNPPAQKMAGAKEAIELAESFRVQPTASLLLAP